MNVKRDEDILNELKNAIRSIDDFPISGIQYKDITPVLLSPHLFKKAVELMCAPYSQHQITKIAAIEARGFIFAAAMAFKLQCGFVPIRKVGKLPAAKFRETYQLEYGEKTLEIHKDSLNHEDRILIVDDLLATGGTALAAAKLVEKLGAHIEGIDFFIELDFLQGRNALGEYQLRSILELGH